MVIQKSWLYKHREKGNFPRNRVFTPRYSTQVFTRSSLFTVQVAKCKVWRTFADKNNWKWRQFEVQKLDYACRNLVIWIWIRNERSRNTIIRTWSYFEQVETIKGKLDIADVEVQITIPTIMQFTWFELQVTFSTLINHLIVNNATIIFHKIPNETFNLSLKSRHIFEFDRIDFRSSPSR